MNIYSFEDFFLHSWWISFMNNCIFHYIANSCTHSDLEQCFVLCRRKKYSLWFFCFLLRNKIPLDPTWWKYCVLKTLVKKKKKTRQYLCCSTQKVLPSLILQQWLFYFKQKQFQLQSENYFNQDNFSLLEFKYVAYLCIFLIKLKQ